MSDITIYNKKNIYDEKIAPLVQQLLNICAVNDIPLFVATAPISTEEETTYKFEYNGPGHNGIILKDDKFVEYLLVTCGQKAQRPGILYDFTNNKDIEDYLYKNPNEPDYESGNGFLECDNGDYANEEIILSPKDFRLDAKDDGMI